MEEKKKDEGLEEEEKCMIKVRKDMWGRREGGRGYG